MNAKTDVVTVGSLRELDKLVAQQLMGWQWDDLSAWKPGISRYARQMGAGKADPWYWLPYYSSDMTAAYEVVDEMRSREYQVTTKSWARIYEHQCCFHDIRESSGSTTCSCQSTMPIAICVAALRVAGTEADVLFIKNDAVESDATT